MARLARNKRRDRFGDKFAALDSKAVIRWGCVLFAATMLASLSARFSFAEIVGKRMPSSAARATSDPRAPLRALLEDYAADTFEFRNVDLRNLARNSLLYDPLDPVPFVGLSLNAAALGDGKKSALYAAMAERITRRDLTSQLVLAEDRVQAGDYVGALRHYDIALRASEEARALLFPVLNSAIDDPKLRRALIPYVQQRANWMTDFILFAGRESIDGARRASKLLLEAGVTRQEDIMVPVTTLLLAQVADSRDTQLLRDLYLNLPGASSALLVTADFNELTTDQSKIPLSWASITEAATGSSFENRDNGAHPSARVFAGSGERAKVLWRLLMLRPGRYRLSETRHSLSAVGNGAYATWVMTCASDLSPRTIWTGPPARAVYQAEGLAGPEIPDDCPLQRLELNVAGGGDPSGMEIIIDQFKLTR